MTPEVIVVPDGLALADMAAERIEDLAVAATPLVPATISLAGGSTPRKAYQRLGSRCAPWARLRIFFGDERCVPPEDEGSNYRMVREALLDRVPLLPEQVHRIPGELEPDDAAAAAEADLRAEFPDVTTPRLDLCVLGIGVDGHTASLFPGGPELDAADRLMVPVHRPELPQPWRVSMTLRLINASRRVMFVADDAAKAEVVARAIAGDAGIPAGRVRPDSGNVTWIITEATAAKLT
ncbi:MAG: 6-phosphogluconolactonase [Thermoleophilia bacterium]